METVQRAHNDSRRPAIIFYDHTKINTDGNPTKTSLTTHELFAASFGNDTLARIAAATLENFGIETASI